MVMLDKLAYSSEIRHKNTGVKWAFSLGILLVVVGFRTPLLSLLVLLLMALLTLRYSSISKRGYLKLMAVPLVFLALGTVVIAFDFTRNGILWSARSLMDAGLLILVSLSAVSCLYFLTLTTPTLDATGLLKKIHCPWIVVELMVLIYRFIFVLLDIAVAIMVAQKCRLGNKDKKTRIKSIGQMLARLLILSLHRSSLLFDAMESRCYDGKLQVLFPDAPPAKRDVAGVVLSLMILASLGIFEKISGGSLWGIL